MRVVFEAPEVVMLMMASLGAIVLFLHTALCPTLLPLMIKILRHVVYIVLPELLGLGYATSCRRENTK